MKGGEKKELSLYGTDDGVRAVGNPVRRHILLLLRDGELSFESIVASSGRAKSTISAHLSALADEGIIGSRPGHDDERKKYFFLRSHYLGELSPADRISDDLVTYAEGYREGEADPFSLYRLIYRTFRVSLLTEGISINPLLRETGDTVGRAVYPAVGADTLPSFADNLSAFFERHHLGRIDEVALDPITFSVYDCFECVELPILGKPACSFEKGFISALFSFQLRQPVDAVELECYAAGDPRCRFEIRDAGPEKNLYRDLPPQNQV